MTTEIALCALCGEPMPAGEEMFKYHGYSGPCPKPPKPRAPAVRFAIVRDMIVTANEDGTIPLNSRVVATIGAADDRALCEELVRRANGRE